MDIAVSLDLRWSDDYAIGSPAIDSQRQQLFALYNRILFAFDSCTGHQHVHDIVTTLISHARRNFANEERLMERIGFESITSHSRKHGELTRQLQQFANELDDGKPVLTYELLVFLRDWIRHHVQDEDCALKDALENWQ